MGRQMNKAANDRNAPIDDLEAAVFGHDRELFQEGLRCIRGMSEIGRRFFLSRVNDYFMGNQGKRRRRVTNEQCRL